MTRNDIMTVECPNCGAGKNMNCLDDYGKPMLRGWHMQRRLSYELACVGSVIEEEIPNVLSTYYLAVTVRGEVEPVVRGSSTSFSTTHSVSLQRIEARSESEAKGKAFANAFSERPGKAVSEILALRHDPSGKGFL